MKRVIAISVLLMVNLVARSDCCGLVDVRIYACSFCSDDSAQTTRGRANVTVGLRQQSPTSQSESRMVWLDKAASQQTFLAEILQNPLFKEMMQATVDIAGPKDAVVCSSECCSILQQIRCVAKCTLFVADCSMCFSTGKRTAKTTTSWGFELVEGEVQLSESMRDNLSGDHCRQFQFDCVPHVPSSSTSFWKWKSLETLKKSREHHGRTRQKRSSPQVENVQAGAQSKLPAGSSDTVANSDGPYLPTLHALLAVLVVLALLSLASIITYCCQSSTHFFKNCHLSYMSLQRTDETASSDSEETSDSRDDCSPGPRDDCLMLLQRRSFERTQLRLHCFLYGKTVGRMCSLDAFVFQKSTIEQETIMGLASSSDQQKLDGPREIILDPAVSSSLIVSVEGTAGKCTTSNSHRAKIRKSELTRLGYSHRQFVVVAPDDSSLPKLDCIIRVFQEGHEDGVISLLTSLNFSTSSEETLPQVVVSGCTQCVIGTGSLQVLERLCDSGSMDSFNELPQGTPQCCDCACHKGSS